MSHLTGLKKRVFLLVFLVMLALTPLVYSLVAYQLSLVGSGTLAIVGFKAYSDQTCTQEITGFSWGVMSPGEQRFKTIYIKNTGNVPLSLSMSATIGPSPAIGFINISWDSEGIIIQPNSSVTVTLTNTISPSITGVTDYQTTITITGTG